MSAPIAVFTYNRPLHTKRMLRSLASNSDVEHSEVTIYCDGPRHSADLVPVTETRKIVRWYAPAGAKVIEREENYGLAKSIITGVTELCELYGRVIVIEDDLVLSQNTLRYMNDALARYADQDNVMHISAYMYPVTAHLPPAFFYREATCWCWGTWQRAWQHFEPDAGKLVNKIDAGNHRREFNLDENMYFYQMLCKQRDGEINSWAIRWYASMFLKNGLALHPGRSLVKNLGFDGSGEHCNIDSRFDVDLSGVAVTEFPTEIAESERARKAMIEYRRKSNTLKSLAAVGVRRLYTRFGHLISLLCGRS